MVVLLWKYKCIVLLVGHRLPGIWLRTGIAGLQYAGVWAETSSLFWLAEEPPPERDAGFVRMSKGLRRTGRRTGYWMPDLCECLRDWPPDWVLHVSPEM